MELQEAAVVQRVLPKAGRQCKQYFARCTRVSLSNTDRQPFRLTVSVGDAVQLDWCPQELFVVAEIEGFLQRSAQK